MDRRIRIIEIVLLGLLVLGLYINFFNQKQPDTPKDYTKEIKQLKKSIESNNNLINKLDYDVEKNIIIIRAASQSQRDSLRSIYNPK